MLNYIKAELWKVSRQGSFYVVTGVLLFCAHLYVLLFTGRSFYQLVSGACGTMFAGVAVVPALVLAAVVLAVQLLVTYLVDHSFKKQSLIDRIRFAE